MRSFRAVICGLLLTAGTIFALPTGNNPRSLLSGNLEDTIVTRNLVVKFGPQVSEANKEAIKAQVIAHHNSLPNGHEQKGAVQAHVHKDWHLTPGEEDKGHHATFRYYKGAVKQKNQLGGGVHVNKPARRELTVSFGPQVSEANKAAIKAQVIAHHNSLPDGHEQKGAVQAHVHKDWHLTPGEEDKGHHATFRYYKAGAKNQTNQLGGGVHVNKPAA